MDGEDRKATTDGVTMKSRSGRRPVTTTSRWLVGRLIRVARDAGCGFVRAPSGAVVYFALTDLAGGESAAAALRPGARLRFKPAGQGVPRATSVAAV